MGDEVHVKHSVKTVRLNINISEQTATTLRRIAGEKGGTVTDVVRQAVALLDLLDTEQKKGREIQLIDTEKETAQTLRLVY